VRRFAAFVVGAVFGLTLSWSGMTNPDVLRNGLLFRDSYLMLFFASALVTAFAGLRVLRRLKARTLLTREPVAWTAVAPRRRHVAGAVLFGVGWAVADACPGPIAAQLGQGVGWSVATSVGVLAGIFVATQPRPAAFRQRVEGVAVAAQRQ